jgi:hypothetical protein
VEYFGLAGWRDAGMTIFKDGVVNGGNNRFCILGRYEENEGVFTIDVEISFIDGRETQLAVEGRFPARIEGKPQGSIFTGSVSRSDISGFHLPIRLNRRSDAM